MGALRLLLLALAAAVIVLIPLSGGGAVYSGWKLVTTVIAPVMAPIVFMVVLLDALMARVFLSEAAPAERGRLKTIIVIDLLAALLIMARWLPYFLSLRA